MTKSRPKPQQRRRRPFVGTLTWSADLAAIFRLAPADYRPPEKVKVVQGQRGVTWTALFHSPTGEGVRATVRTRRDSAGKLFVTEEGLAFTFRDRARPEGA